MNQIWLANCNKKPCTILSLNFLLLLTLLLFPFSMGTGPFITLQGWRFLSQSYSSRLPCDCWCAESRTFDATSRFTGHIYKGKQRASSPTSRGLWGTFTALCRKGRDKGRTWEMWVGGDRGEGAAGGQFWIEYRLRCKGGREQTRHCVQPPPTPPKRTA